MSRQRGAQQQVWMWIALVTSLVASSLLAGGCVQRSEGEQLWRDNCARCHGIDGGGTVPKYRKYAGADLMDDNWDHGDDDGSIETVIREGIFPTMPGFNEDLTDEQVRNIISYLREMRGET